ncbi:nuclear distribution protein PAC1 [Metschnikowia bicuspidata var. bicuspidata NRRL YB-4993]|uniref:Nuclear distribution protein PAC1 n=1 Tax=Metschnikowia bicuspidata var. bicuspidata NRRL YB-4993 TaxID=869754 RepID=A0A1A0HA57_9ASCO|nr:nuclear distribution protein PAC1 [Metschnikowia bicuspidata var. bicuspidata NRRL YB-4993]OBA20758.1 nuclear distribution protein PAC1 [Metschnikowia bicuspidata var. bicuspidata NRRL YB-4993]
MSSILTARQTLELHKAIVQYLAPVLDADADTLGSVCRALDATPTDAPVAHYLEKKWLTVLRLQKRILDLENEVASYKLLIETANLAPNGSPLVSRDKINWLPSAVKATYPTQSAQIVNTVAVHPQLPLLAAGCADGAMLAWDLAADDVLLPLRLWNAHSRSLHCLRWSDVPIDLSGPGRAAPAPSLAPAASAKSASYVLASCSSDLTVKIWLGDAFTHMRTLTGHEHTVSSVAFSPSSPLFLYSVSRDKAVKVWDLASGHCVSTFVGHSDWVRDLDVAAVNSRLLLAAVHKSAALGDFILTCSNDQSVRLSHQLGTGLSMLLGHTHVVETVRFLPMLANKHIDKYLLLNMDRFPYLLDNIVENPVYTESLGFKYCVSAGRDNVLKLWLLPPPVLLPHRLPLPSVQNNSQGWHILDLLGHQLWVKSVETHPNGRFIISGADDKLVRVWDLATLVEQGRVACVKTLTAHEGFVNAVHFARFKMSATGDTREDRLKLIEKSMRCLFVSAGTDNTVRLWQ